MRLVKDHHAIGDAMELTATGGAVIVKRFKELHRRSHHDGHIPVLRCVFQALLPIIYLTVVVFVINDAAVMLQHNVIPEDLTENGRGLLNNGGIGDHVNDAILPCFSGMTEGKGKRGHGLTASRRHRERI